MEATHEGSEESEAGQSEADEAADRAPMVGEDDSEVTSGGEDSSEDAVKDTGGGEDGDGPRVAGESEAGGP